MKKLLTAVVLALSALTASATNQLVVPAKAVSINITAGTGSVTLYVMQAGLR